MPLFPIAPRQMISVSMLLVMMIHSLFTVKVVESTVSYGEHTYESMPSHFGMSWSPSSRTYQAHLQFLSDRAKLCPPTDEEEEGQGQEGLKLDSFLDGLITPNDTIPVALLVERGNCSFEDKATIAMQAYPYPVSFMVVYDDKPSKNLVSMRETYSDHGVKVGMLFVSWKSGMHLREVLSNQTQVINANGGPIIQLDGLDPLLLHEPSLKDLQTWILIAMGGFFTFVTVFGCLLVFVQLGVIPVNGAGQIILTSEAIRRSRRLLTRDEVARLQPGGDLHGSKCVSNTTSSFSSSGHASDEVIGTQPSADSPIDDHNDHNHGNGDGGGEGDVPTTTNNNSNNTASAAVNPPIESEEDNVCSICLDDLSTGGGDDGNLTLCLPCDHKFHSDCIIPWLTERHATCPLCKFDLLEFIMELDEKDEQQKQNKFSFTWWKRQTRRFCGWSPIRSTDSQSSSDSQVVDLSSSSTSSSLDNDNEQSNNNDDGSPNNGENPPIPYP